MRLPDDTQSTLILGKNGSGKSRAAVWHLAQKDLENFPWVVINHKNEELIDSIPGAEMVKLNFTPKKNKGGVYIYHPERDDDAVTNLIWRIYMQEKIGVYIDEGYMFNPRDKAMTAIYTQGRSKQIPIITLSQRPSLINRFAVSEAGFYQVFYLSDKRDRDKVNAFIPDAPLDKLMTSVAGAGRPLPDFHSVYYDVGKDDLVIMAPVPGDDIILSLFENKLKNKNKKNLFNL